MKADADAAAYINPEIAEEHRQKGNEFFKKNDYPSALKEYEEGLKRDPKCLAIYSNRCATYIKLMIFNDALKDADKCLESKWLQPNNIIIHITHMFIILLLFSVFNFSKISLFV